MNRNIANYLWSKFLQSLSFWEETWFLYFESRLSASEAILLFVIYDVFHDRTGGFVRVQFDRLGRKVTLLSAGLSGFAAAILFVLGDDFMQVALANVLLGGATAFASGTDSALAYESLKEIGEGRRIEALELNA